MKRLEIIITIFAILFIISSCKTTSTINSSVDNDSNIDKATKVIDITQIDTSEANEHQQLLLELINILKTNHPCLTPNDLKYIDEEKFNNLASEIYYQLEKVMKNDDLDNFRYYYLASKLLSLLNDGHTELLPSSRYALYYNEPYFPIAMHWFENELYIINTFKRYEELKNKKVLKLGNIDIKRLKEEVNKFISSDNIYERNKFNGNMLCRGIILELLGLLNKDNTVTIEYLDNNKIKKVALPLINIENKFDELWGNRFNICKNNITFCNNNMSYLNDKKNIHINYKFLPKYSSMYLQLNNFKDSENLPIKFNNIFKEIKQNKVNRLIIDLRNNMGGNSNVVYQLLNYINNGNENHLKTTKSNSFPIPFTSVEDHFNGEVYVLTSSYTFSAGSYFSEIVKDNGYATIIGEPTGCSSFTHYNARQILLQNNKRHLTLSFGLHARANKEARISEPDAVYPDVYIPTTFEDHINGRDPVWDYLVENVFNKP